MFSCQLRAKSEVSIPAVVTARRVEPGEGDEAVSGLDAAY